MSKLVKQGLAAVLAATVAAGPLAVPAHAADADAEALAQCVQLSTSGKDRILTARWLMGALASAPQLEDMVRVDPELKRQSDMGMAALFTRLLTVDCLSEAKVVFRGGDSTAGVRYAGESLGEIAMQELFGDEAALAGLTSYTEYLEQADFEVLKD